MSEYEQKTIDLQSQILAETQRQTRLETEFYQTAGDRENKVVTGFHVIKETLRELFFTITGGIQAILPILLFFKGFRKLFFGIFVGLKDFYKRYNKQFKDRNKRQRKDEKLGQARVEKFLVDTLKFTLVTELIAGFFKVQFGIFKRFVVGPLVKIAEATGLYDLLYAPVQAIREGIDKLGNFVKDNFLKLILVASGLLYFFKTDNTFIASIRTALDESLSKLVSTLFKVEDQGGFLNTFKEVWKTKWLPTLNDGWEATVGGLTDWWEAEDGGLDQLKKGWNIIKTGTMDWWKESGRPLLLSAFGFVAEQIKNAAKTIKDLMVFGSERESLESAEDVGNIFQQLRRIQDPRIKERQKQLEEQFIAEGMNPLIAKARAFDQVRFEPSYIDKDGNLVFGLSPRAAKEKEERDRLLFEGKLFQDKVTGEFTTEDPTEKLENARKKVREGIDFLAGLFQPGLSTEFMNFQNNQGTAVFRQGFDLSGNPIADYRELVGLTAGGAPIFREPIIIDGKSVYNNYTNAPNNFFNSSTKHIYDINGANSGSGN